MKRLFLILFALMGLLYVAHCDNVQQEVCAVQTHSLPSEIVDNNFRVELICCREYNSDMLLRTSRTIVSVGQNNLTSLNNSVRSRNESQLKGLEKAVPESHSGHITRVFEFNHFKSSLRVVYYLYALCRLRI